MAKAAQITFKDFRTRFETEDDCRDYLSGNVFRMDLFAPNAETMSFTISKHATFASASTAAGKPLSLRVL